MNFNYCVSPWPEAGRTLIKLKPGIGISPNGPLPATLPEANRAEGNVGERCAAAARTPSPPDTQ